MRRTRIITRERMTSCSWTRAHIRSRMRSRIVVGNRYRDRVRDRSFLLVAVVQVCVSVLAVVCVRCMRIHSRTRVTSCIARGSIIRMCSVIRIRMCSKGCCWRRRMRRIRNHVTQLSYCWY